MIYRCQAIEKKQTMFSVDFRSKWTGGDAYPAEPPSVLSSLTKAAQVYAPRAAFHLPTWTFAHLDTCTLEHLPTCHFPVYSIQLFQ